MVLVIKDLRCWFNIYNGVKRQVHTNFTFTIMGSLYCTTVWLRKPEQDQLDAQQCGSESLNKISWMHSRFTLHDFAATCTLYITLYKLWNTDWSWYATLHHAQLSLAVQYAGHLFIKSVPCIWDDCTVSTISEQEARKHTQYSHQATGWMIQGWMPDRGKSCCSYWCCPDWSWGSATPIFKG